MPYKPGEIENALQGKFHFSPSTSHSSNHRWYELSLPGLPLIVTKVSHGKKQIGRKLESMIARQLRVRTSFLREMINCTKDREDYYSRVTEDPFPPWNIQS